MYSFIQVREACHERVIGIDNKSIDQSRKDLESWVAIIDSQPTVAGRMIENTHNKRLCIMGWHLAKGFKTSETSTIFRALCGSN